MPIVSMIPVAWTPGEEVRQPDQPDRADEQEGRAAEQAGAGRENRGGTASSRPHIPRRARYARKTMADARGHGQPSVLTRRAEVAVLEELQHRHRADEVDQGVEKRDVRETPAVR